jgi:hypothetical protein
MAEPAKSGFTAGDAVDAVALGGKTSWNIGKRLAKEASWLLKTTWKAGSFLARKYPKAAAILTLLESGKLVYDVVTHEKLEKTLGTPVKSAQTLASASMKDPNVADATLDTLNSALPSGNHLLEILPPDVSAQLSGDYLKTLADRWNAKNGSKPVSSGRKAPVTPTNELTANLDLVDAVGSIFGRRDSASIARTHTVLRAFMALTSDELMETLTLRGHAR